MITPLNRGSAWWTNGKSHSRRSALGASAIVVVLALIVGLIWMSPSDSPVKKLVNDVVTPISTTFKLQKERANLMSELVSSKSTMDNQAAALTKQKAAIAAQLGKNAALSKQLSVAKAESARYAGQIKALKAQMAAAGGTSTLANGASGANGAAGSGTATGSGSGTSPSGGGTTDPIGPVPVTTPTLASIIKPASRYFGLYTAQSPFSFSEFNQLATDAGEQPNISGYFQGWNQDFRADAVQASWAKGDLPMMTWESQPNTANNNSPGQAAYSLKNITAGNFDAYLKKYADAIVANGQPLAIRLDQEMNATWYPWATSDGHGGSINGNTGSDFVDMWRHVHTIFANEGANKLVAWVWAPNRVDNLPKANQTLDYTKSLYPGDDYVDWIGMSGYERPSGDGPQDGTFGATFAKTLALLRATPTVAKPIILAEIGAAENGAAGKSIKPTWIANLFDALAEPENADIIGFSWFNLTVTTSLNGQTVTNDWRINSTAASTAAFAKGIQRSDIGYKLTPTPQ